MCIGKGDKSYAEKLAIVLVALWVKFINQFLEFLLQKKSQRAKSKKIQEALCTLKIISLSPKA